MSALRTLNSKPNILLAHLRKRIAQVGTEFVSDPNNRKLPSLEVFNEFVGVPDELFQSLGLPRTEIVPDHIDHDEAWLVHAPAVPPSDFTFVTCQRNPTCLAGV